MATDTYPEVTYRAHGRDGHVWAVPPDEARLVIEYRKRREQRRPQRIRVYHVYVDALMVVIHGMAVRKDGEPIRRQGRIRFDRADDLDLRDARTVSG